LSYSGRQGWRNADREEALTPFNIWWGAVLALPAFHVHYNENKDMQIYMLTEARAVGQNLRTLPAPAHVQSYVRDDQPLVVLTMA
jgi:hypothetical protein